MNKLNKVLLCSGIIAAISGISPSYAAQNPGAGEMFDSLSPDQQKQFIYGTYKKLKNDKEFRRNAGIGLALQVLKKLLQETKQNLGAGEMFDSLSPDQQKQFIYGTYKKLKNDKE